MNRAGSHRNFGYGKQMAWAGKRALRDRYGDGRYGTVAGHAECWRNLLRGAVTNTVSATPLISRHENSCLPCQPLLWRSTKY